MLTIVSIVSMVIIAAATLIYASLTYFLLREQQREKRKPRIQEIVNVVLHPLIEQLESQKGYIKGGNLERIHEIHVGTTGRREVVTKLITFSGKEKLIYDKFKKEHLSIATKIESYDDKVEELKGVLNEYWDKVISLPDFVNKLSEKFEEYKERESHLHVPSFELKRDNLKTIALYIIHNKPEFEESDQHAVYYKFWNLYGKELREFRKRPELKNYKKDIEKRHKDLLKSADRLSKGLRAILDKHTDKYGVTYK